MGHNHGIHNHNDDNYYYCPINDCPCAVDSAVGSSSDHHFNDHNYNNDYNDCARNQHKYEHNDKSARNNHILHDDDFTAKTQYDNVHTDNNPSNNFNGGSFYDCANPSTAGAGGAKSYRTTSGRSVPES
jgi:hypothetical protein